MEDLLTYYIRHQGSTADSDLQRQFSFYQCVRYDLLLRHVKSRQLVHLIE